MGDEDIGDVRLAEKDALKLDLARGEEIEELLSEASIYVFVPDGPASCRIEGYADWRAHQKPPSRPPRS
jgi:hypothetical protein